MNEIEHIIRKVVDAHDLSMDEASGAIGAIMRGETSAAQTAALLTALRMKGETASELAGAALAMRSFARRVSPRRSELIDTCGTGGDSSASFNISTTAAFIAAGMGLAVAKHGNRAVSSRCGSADVLSALGVDIELEPEQMALCIDEAGIGFLYAPLLHPAMQHAAPVRRELGLRTIFNMLGPLTNPAGASRQLVGAFSPRAAELMAEVLAMLGSQHALVVCSEDGMDEISLAAPTQVYEVLGGAVLSYYVTPESLGLPRVPAELLSGGDAAHNAQLLLSVLRGDNCPAREIALVNAAAAAYVGGLCESIAAGLEPARESIDSGRALHALEQLRRVSSGVAKGARA